VRYQAVRFQKPGFFTWRRLGGISVYTLIVYGYVTLAFRYLDVEIEILDDAELEAERKEEGRDGEGREVTDAEDDMDDDDDVYAEEDSTFIPLTWATKLPRAFYKGSDPEWQEFIKVAKDKGRRKKIQDDLVQLVFTSSKQHPTIARQLGKDTKIGTYWLDISFPDGPPPEYERQGLEIGDGFVAWSKQRVTQEQQWRLMRALWPTAMVDSVWQTTKVLAGIQYRRVKQALGWEGRDPFSPEERYRHAMEMTQKQQAAREGKGGIGKTQQQAPDGSSDPSSTLSARSDATASPDSKPAASEGKKLPLGISVPLPGLPSTASPNPDAQPNLDLPIAMNVFSRTLSKRWHPPKETEPPRGTFVVQGLVEIKGQRGRMLFDVTSCYDPKLNKYVVVNASVRGFKRWNQSPRGGP
jgi:hypothetical protein